MCPIEYVHLRPGETPPRLPFGTPFKAILVVEAEADPAWRTAVAEWLVQSGCRFASAWGRDCSAWHDDIDLANIRAFPGRAIADDDFVMTTWHADEPLEEVFWFASCCASHPTLTLDRTCILHIAAEERREDIVELYRRSQDRDQQE